MSSELVCSAGKPFGEDFGCPVDEYPNIYDETFMVDISYKKGYYYYSLDLDYRSRLERIEVLVSSLYRSFLSFQGQLGHWEQNYPSTIQNPFDEPDRPQSVTVQGRGFSWMAGMLALLDRKLNYINKDISLTEPVASVVEHWQLRPEAHRPQAIFLFGEANLETGIIGPPKWQLAVPHFQKSGIGDFSNSLGWKKGSRQCIYTLNDNSKIILYADSDETAKGVIDEVSQGIPDNYLSKAFLKFGDYRSPAFGSQEVRLRRVDWYERKGVSQSPDAFVRYSKYL